MRLNKRFSKVNLYCMLTFIGMLPYWCLKSMLSTVTFVLIYVLYAILIRVVADKIGK
jgi:hypothetical protein